MAIGLSKIEFDLTVRKYGEKHEPYESYDPRKKPQFEVMEELKFKSLDVREVMRKLLDYFI